MRKVRQQLLLLILKLHVIEDLSYYAIKHLSNSRSGTKLEIFEGRGLSNIKGHTKHFLNRMYLEIMFIRFRNNRNRTGSFRVSILSFVTKITRRSPTKLQETVSIFSKIKGTFIFLEKRGGGLDPQDPPRNRAPVSSV